MRECLVTDIDDVIRFEIALILLRQPNTLLLNPILGIDVNTGGNSGSAEVKGLNRKLIGN